MKKLPVKAIISSLLLLVLLFLAITGSMLHFGKTGVVMGFARSALRNSHTWAAALMCILVIIHLILNRRLYLSELKSLVKRRDNKRGTDNNE